MHTPSDTPPALNVVPVCRRGVLYSLISLSTFLGKKPQPEAPPEGGRAFRGCVFGDGLPT